MAVEENVVLGVLGRLVGGGCLELERGSLMLGHAQGFDGDAALFECGDGEDGACGADEVD